MEHPPRGGEVRSEEEQWGGLFAKSPPHTPFKKLLKEGKHTPSNKRTPKHFPIKRLPTSSSTVFDGPPSPPWGRLIIAALLAQTGRGGACSSRIRDPFQIRTHPRRGELRSPEISDLLRVAAMFAQKTLCHTGRRGRRPLRSRMIFAILLAEWRPPTHGGSNPALLLRCGRGGIFARK